MATLESIEAAVLEVRDLLQSGAGTTPPGSPALIYPGPNGLAIIQGWVFAIDEPIAADWKPSMEAVEKMARYGRIGADPSNAFDSGLPKRSSITSTPMFYPVGQYGPTPPGRLMYGGSTFADEAELAEYKARVIAYPGTGGSFSPGRPG